MTTEIIPNAAEFIKVYNDRKKYPTLNDVAGALSLKRKTVKNRAAILRGWWRASEAVPLLISRATITSNTTSFKNSKYSVEAPEVTVFTPRHHARTRADILQEELRGLIQRSRYPIINPEAITVDSYVRQTYQSEHLNYREVAATPRTWINDTLRAAPIADSRYRRYIFTGAQNDAELHKPFWENLKAYAAHINAEIIVGVWTYETQWWSENNPVARSYASELADHLCFGQLEIGSDFVFCGDVNILPTAKRPLQGLRTHSRGRWGVFPHSRLQLQSIPSTNPAKQSAQIMTTGACTKPKVIPRLAGNKAIFHHVIGATLVEFDEDGDLFCRQLNADSDGSFFDLTNHVTYGHVYKGLPVKSVVAADLHIAKLGVKNCRAVFGFDAQGSNRVFTSMMSMLQPEYLFIHDGHDQEIGSHHRVGDGHFNFMLAMRNRTSIEDEVRRFGHFLMLLDNKSRKTVVVESNHDLAFTRYIKEGRYRNDGINALFGARLEVAELEYQQRVAFALDHELPTPRFSLLEHAVRSLFGMTALAHVEWAYDGYSYVVGGVECGHHGFRGANGSHGTPEGFSEMGSKMTIGDKHTPQILDGVYVAGAMELQQGYNKGPSSWAVAHVVQYANDKRAIVTMQNGKWRA